MALVNLTLRNGAFPSGTVVSLFQTSVPAASQPRGGPPGTPAATATVAADGSLTFTGVTDDKPYLAYASVNGNDVFASVTATSEIAPPPHFGRFADGQVPQWAAAAGKFIGAAGGIAGTDGTLGGPGGTPLSPTVVLNGQLQQRRLAFFGHSFPDGGGVTRLHHAFPAITAALLNLPQDNYSIAGSTSDLQILGMLQRVLQTIAPVRQTAYGGSVTAGPWLPVVGAAVLYTAINDPFNEGGTYLVENYRAAINRLRASAVFEAESDASWAFGGSGTWQTNIGVNNSGTGIRYANTNGATFTINVPSDFPGGNIQLGCVENNASGGIWSMTVDGAAAPSWNTLGVGVANGRPVPYEIANLAAGVHTIVGTLGSVRNTASVDYWQAIAADPPIVVAAGPSYSPAYSPNSNIDAWRSSLQSLVAGYTDGRVLFWDTQIPLANGADQSLWDMAGVNGATGVHPNWKGHKALALDLAALLKAKFQTLSPPQVQGAPVDAIYQRRAIVNAYSGVGSVALVNGAATVQTRAMRSTNTLISLTPQTSALTGAPPAPAPTTAGTGGTIAAGTYTIAITYVNRYGESKASATAQVTTTGTTSTITIPSPPAGGVITGWYAYVSQAGGAVLTRQQAAGSPTAIGTNLTLSAPPTNTGANPPTADTTGSTGVLSINSKFANVGNSNGSFSISSSDPFDTRVVMYELVDPVQV